MSGTLLSIVMKLPQLIINLGVVCMFMSSVVLKDVVVKS